MTREETIKILAVLKGLGVKFEGDSQVIVEIWADCFKNDDYLQVNGAIKKLMIQEKQLFQNGLIAKIKDLLVPEDVFLDSASAWNQVRRAMKKSYPDIPSTTNDAFKELDPLIQKVLGNSHTLIEWEYETATDDMNTVIKSNFIKEYNNLCRIYKDDFKNGGKMLEYLKKPKLELENKEKVKLVENLVKDVCNDMVKF
jgi:hypothetical protein